MKQSLLDLTQEILSALNSDSVNSIGDTTESLQVATIIRRVYFNILARAKIPADNELFQLAASTDPDKPTLMYKPDKVSKIHWVKYYDTNLETIGGSGGAPTYRDVYVIPVEQYVNMVNNFNPSEPNVGTFEFEDEDSTFTFNFYNDRFPQFCTEISNNWILFDGYDNEVDSTLQASKTLCYGQVIPTFDMVDNFIPDLDDNQFPLLLNEAKELAFFEIKESPHPLADREVKRQWSTVQKNKRLFTDPSDFDQLPNFGRICRY